MSHQSVEYKNIFLSISRTLLSIVHETENVTFSSELLLASPLISQWQHLDRNNGIVHEKQSTCCRRNSGESTQV